MKSQKTFKVSESTLKVLKDIVKQYQDGLITLDDVVRKVKDESFADFMRKEEENETKRM